VGDYYPDLIRARLYLTRQDFAAARALLESVINHWPRATELRVLLSHVLLQEGVDTKAAQQALCDVLALDPIHKESRHNLSVLLNQGCISSGDKPCRILELADHYREAATAPSDIHEHLPILYMLARECRHVTEMGTRTGISTTAFLFARPEYLVCYDTVKLPQINRLQDLADNTRFLFHETDVLQTDIDPTDLLFIDTWHVYQQLREELRLHAAKVRKYIVLHDTTTFAYRGETGGHCGLWPAVDEFLRLGSFKLKERHVNNNGLTVLEAV